MRIDDSLDRYLVQLQADGRSEHTVRQIRRHVRLLASWLEGDVQVEEIGHEHLAKFLASDSVRLRSDGKERKATSANSLRSSLRTFFAFLHAAGYAPTNPARLVRRAFCSGGPPRALTESEQDRLVAALGSAQTVAEQRDQALFMLMLKTGIRLGSALGLQVEHVDLVDALQLRLLHAKGNRESVVYVPESVTPLLERQIGSRESGQVFPGQAGAALSPRHVQRRLGMWSVRAGITRSVSPHSLRHSFAGRLYEKTGDLLLVKEALCHRGIGSTAVYVTANQRRLREAVAG